MIKFYYSLFVLNFFVVVVLKFLNGLTEFWESFDNETSLLSNQLDLPIKYLSTFGNYSATVYKADNRAKELTKNKKKIKK